jgi:hypothetical protein
MLVFLLQLFIGLAVPAEFLRAHPPAAVAETDSARHSYSDLSSSTEALNDPNQRPRKGRPRKASETLKVTY